MVPNGLNFGTFGYTIFVLTLLSKETFMADPTVRVIKFDTGSPTDLALARMQEKLSASSTVEAMRRSLTIADAITDLAAKGQEIYVKAADGSMSTLVIS